MVLLSSLPADFKGQLEFSKEADRRILPMQKELEAWNNIELFNQLNIDEINNVYKKIFTLYLYNKDKISDIQIDFEEKSAINGYLIESEMSKHSIFHEDVNLVSKLTSVNILTLIIHGAQRVCHAGCSPYEHTVR